jgi:uncharacterized transporter YbjL
LQFGNPEERVTANVVASLRQNPELAIFLTLALGFLLGHVRVRSFNLGNVVGTLLAGVLIGQLAIKVNPLVEVVFFDLFLFATGYKVGPQFFRGLKKNAMPQVLLTLPEPALWVLDTIGLAVFIGVVGLNAGPSFITGLRVMGPSLLVVRINPVILLGSCAGAGTATAALRAIQDEAGSKLPVLGYTVPYAIGNILLTAWGPVTVLLAR